MGAHAGCCRPGEGMMVLTDTGEDGEVNKLI
jgi:hypothetical protein